MRKIVITYGLISGSIVAGLMFARIPIWNNPSFKIFHGEIAGYTTMVVALSLVFFGIKSCRDNNFNGFITFGQGVKVGLMISLIAAVMYACAWEVCYQTIASDFTEKMFEQYVETAKSSSLSKEEMEATLARAESFREWYKNPVLRFGMTLTEILPVGILITLISAALLKKKQMVQTTS